RGAQRGVTRRVPRAQSGNAREIFTVAASARGQGDRPKYWSRSAAMTGRLGAFQPNSTGCSWPKAAVGCLEVRTSNGCHHGRRDQPVTPSRGLRTLGFSILSIAGFARGWMASVGANTQGALDHSESMLFHSESD